MKYTKETLEAAVQKSTSWSGVCRILGIKASTGSQTYITNKAKEFKIEHSHFLGKAHLKGGIPSNKKDALERCKKGIKISSHKLKLFLIRDGYKKAECENCGLSKWMGEESVLELDHIDNDKTNNEFDNLKILCPNCHALKTRLAQRQRQ